MDVYLTQTCKGKGQEFEQILTGHPLTVNVIAKRASGMEGKGIFCSGINRKACVVTGDEITVYELKCLVAPS